MQRRFLTTCAVALLCAGCSPAIAGDPPPTPVADYDFVGWLGDALGNGPKLAPVGLGTLGFVEVNADGDTRLVLSVPANNGLRLSSGALLPLDAYSIAIVVSVVNTSVFGKLVDTNNLSSDLGLYTFGNGLVYFTAGDVTPGSFPNGALRQAVVTRTADGNYTGYLDGVQQFSFDDAANSQLTLIDPARVIHFLRDDDTTSNSEESEATLHRIRLFDRALTAGEVAALEGNRGQVTSVFRGGGFESFP